MCILMLLALAVEKGIGCVTFSSVSSQITAPSVSRQGFGVTDELQCTGRVGEAQDSAHELLSLPGGSPGLPSRRASSMLQYHPPWTQASLNRSTAFKHGATQYIFLTSQCLT